MRRFEIAQDSMLPNLRPGDEVVAIDSRSPEVGDVVVFPHPRRDDFWLVKRMAVPPREIGDDEAWVLSDNPAPTRADSRTLGPIDRRSLWKVVERLDPDSFGEACRLLAEEDEDLAAILETHGLPEFWERRPGFQTLVLLILEQQVSLESGAAMYRRLKTALDGVDAKAIDGFGEEGLRSIGVTRQKTGYLLDIARMDLSGELSLGSLDRMGAMAARQSLLRLRGVGPWTADAYLLSALRFPDIFPTGDRALKVGTGETLGLKAVPDQEQLEIVSHPWRPIRAAAARLIWHAYLTNRGRVEPPDPTLTHGNGRFA